MITSTKQIEIICREARALGMSYGQYVALHPNRFPRPQDMEGWAICKECGEIFEIPRLKSGAVSKRIVRCNDCIEKERKKKEEKREARLLKYNKVYTVHCTDCGRETTTRQPPRSGCNIYCPECREKRRHKSKKESA